MSDYSLKSLLDKGEQALAPCIWDCMSARAAEVCGYNAMLLSSALFAYSCAGIPDIGLITLDEVEWAVKRITESSPLPLIIDAEDGYGTTTLHCYRSVQRLIRAGASALTIEDSVPLRGTERFFGFDEAGNQIHIDPGHAADVVPQKEWLSKIEAALEAASGTDAIIIARTHAYYSEGFDEAMDRAVKATKLGAPMTYVSIPHWQNNYDTCKTIAKRLPGWKMYGDVFSKDGVTDITLDDAMNMGFNLVTLHCLSYGSFFGMCDFGKHNFENRSTVYSDNLRTGGEYLKKEMLAMQDYNSQKMLSIEKRCFAKADEYASRHAPAVSSRQELW